MQFFNKKNIEEREEEFEDKLVKENQEELNKIISSDVIPVSIIYYYIDESERKPMIKTFTLVENFPCGMLPEKDSIIWVSIDGNLSPFKVIRYDFFATEDLEQTMKVYVVVKPAKSGEILDTGLVS